MKHVMLMFVLMLVMTSCDAISPKTNVIEQISPVILLYLQEGEHSEIDHTIVIPSVINEKKQILTAHGKLLKEARSQMNRNYYRQIKYGQLRILFISEKLAEQGLMDVLKALLLDPQISKRLYLAVMEGDFTSYLKEQINHQEGIDLFIYNMFRHYEQQGDLTIVHLHDFLKRLFSNYSDPVLPIFKIQQEQLIYAGTALFQHDRMVKSIPREEDFLFQFLCQKQCFHTTITMQDLQLVLGNVKSRRHIRFDRHFERVTFDLQLHGRVEEYNGTKNLQFIEEATELQHQVERYIEERLQDVIQSWQALSIDPIHVGTKTLNPFRQPFKGSAWKEHWKGIPVEVQVDINFENLGMVKIE